MNYIPGFSNYLEASMPRYAKGGPARFNGEDIYGGAGLLEQPMANAGGLSSNSGSNFGASEDLKQKLAAEAMAAMDTPRQAAVAPTTQAVAPAAGPLTEAEERAQLLAYIPPELLAGVNPNDFDLRTLRDIRKSADLHYWNQKEAAYKKANPSGIYALADPAEYFKAYGTVPISFTGYSGYMDKGVKGPSIDYLTPEAGATYSLYSPKTGQLIGTGTGVEGLLALTKQANEMNESQGRKADFQLVKTGAGSSTPEVLGTNLYNSDRTALGKVMGVVGQALPLATLAIPGLNVLGSIAVGAGLGGVGAQLQGKNALKGAAMGGLSAAGGQVLGKALQAGGTFGTAVAPRLATAIGTGIGSTAGGLVTGQSLKNALLSGVASGGLSYLSPNIQEGLGIGKAPSVNASTGSGGGGDIVVSGYRPVSIGTSLGGSQNKIQQALNQKTEVPYDGLTVTGNRFGNTFGVDLGGNRFGTPGSDTSAFEKMYTDPADPNEILVKATPATQPTPVSVPVTGPLTTTAPAELPNDIVVKARQIADADTTPVSSGFTLSSDTLSELDKLSEAEAKKKAGLENYLGIAGKAVGLLGNLLGDGKGGSGSGTSGTYIPGGAGGGRLNPIFSAQLPAAGGLGNIGNIGATRMASALGDVDWLTYGTRPELKFFDYSTTPANPAPVTTPVPGNPAGPIMGGDTVRHSEEGIPLWMQLGLPNPNAPAAQPGAAGQIMEERDPTAMAKGGAFAAKRGGPSKRTEFAVNGPGTGRSDDIPAVLSDGEYVIDAETVALLGDGSSKAGAKKLDELRVKVRKHKGQKLAKGRFSANAKKPEAYLSGGRI